MYPNNNQLRINYNVKVVIEVYINIYLRLYTTIFHNSK